MVVQSTYGGAPERARRGQIQRYEYIKGREIAMEGLEPDALAVYSGNPAEKDKIRKPMQTKNVLKGTVDLVASNSTVGTVTTTDLRGVETQEVLTATAYATSHSATLAAIAAKIEALDHILSATADATARIITVIADGDYHVDLSAFATTLGAGQPAWSYVPGSVDKVAGIVTNLDTEPNDDGFAYEEGDLVKLMVRGRVSAVVEEAVDSNSTLCARFKAGSGTNEHRGVIRASKGTPEVAFEIGAGIGLHTPASADGIADFELNLLGA